jgi:uncharacterized protein YjbK
MVEIEYKYELSREQFLHICSRFTWDEISEMDNYYYDDQKLTLYSKDITIRVRKLNNKIILESKLPESKSDDGVIRISKERSCELSCVPNFLDQSIVFQMTDLILDGVENVGKLKTTRRRKKLENLTIFADMCKYLGKIDYELELEIENGDYITDIDSLTGLSGLKPSDGKRSRFIKKKEDLGNEHCLQ